MKAVIFAGGYGTRLSEETDIKPKPMVEIGGRPILWHIMKLYAHYGIEEFIICLGYKGQIIKQYFIDYYHHNADLTINLKNGKSKIINSQAENWKVTLADTGQNTQTGGRLKRISKYLSPNNNFCLTYGDGISNVNISKLIDFHKSHDKLATITAVQTPGRFGVLKTDKKNKVLQFNEKPNNQTGRINGGFFVLKPKVLDFIADDLTSWEKGPLTQLANKGQLMSFKHDGFWQPCDTLRDKRYLEHLWTNGKVPWKVWKS